MSSRLTFSMTLPQCQHLAYNITHVVLIVSRYGMDQVSRDDSLYIIKTFVFAMDEVASL